MRSSTKDNNPACPIRHQPRWPSCHAHSNRPSEDCHPRRGHERIRHRSMLIVSILNVHHCQWHSTWVSIFEAREHDSASISRPAAPCHSCPSRTALLLLLLQNHCRYEPKREYETTRCVLRNTSNSPCPMDPLPTAAPHSQGYSSRLRNVVVVPADRTCCLPESTRVRARPMQPYDDVRTPLVPVYSHRPDAIFPPWTRTTTLLLYYYRRDHPALLHSALVSGRDIGQIDRIPTLPTLPVG
mmetsp:Transcript_2251/g.3941  ORF Transcript_2251/g.3941 Transcript_2251/m.3941 type:complete len:241 (+) Transcript_2251:420-1142(+)